MRARYTVAGAVLLFLAGCDRPHREGDIPVVGLDAQNETRVFYLPHRFSSEKYGRIVAELHDRLLPGLDALETEKKNTPERGKDSPWELRRIRVGLTLLHELGIGVLGLDVRAFLELWFTKTHTAT